jgi:hypothetical protein
MSVMVVAAVSGGWIDANGAKLGGRCAILMALKRAGWVAKTESSA